MGSVFGVRIERGAGLRIGFLIKIPIPRLACVAALIGLVARGGGVILFAILSSIRVRGTKGGAVSYTQLTLPTIDQG